jgi:hypothetical protein
LGERLGIEDPEQWLEDCPDRVYDRWVAAYRLNPFGDEQLLLARLCSLMFLMVREKYGDETCDAMNSLTKLFMPSDWIGSLSSKQSLKIDLDSIKRSQDIAAARF